MRCQSSVQVRDSLWIIRPGTLLALAVLLTSLYFAPTAGAEDRPDSLSPYEVAQYGADYGVSPSTAEERLRTQRNGAGIVESLRGAVGEEYAGVSFDNRTGQYRVAVLDAVDRKDLQDRLDSLGLEGHVQFVPARHSWQELSESRGRLARILRGSRHVGGFALSIDTDSNSLLLRRPAGLSGAAQNTVAAAIDRVNVPVVVKTSREQSFTVSLDACKTAKPRHCDKPLRGGVEIGALRPLGGETYAYQPQCTAGFKAIGNLFGNRYMLTAGHCIPASGGTYDWASTVTSETIKKIGPVEEYQFGATGDWAKIRANGSWWEEIPSWPSLVAHYSANETYPINYEGWSFPGQYACFSGMQSGTSCGTVVDTSVEGYESTEGIVLPPMTEVSGVCSEGGDSGGPLFSFSSNLALGMLTGSTEESAGCNITVFSEIVRASNNLGVTVGTRIGGPPSASTGSATAISGLKATVSGTVNPNQVPTDYRFEYGQTTQYGNSSPVPDGYAGHGSSVTVAASLANLKPETIYNYRLVATSASGVSIGANKQFETGPGTPLPLVEEDFSPGPRALGNLQETDHVFYRTVSGGLGHDWYGPGQSVWGVETIGGTLTTGTDPHAVKTAAGASHVFYRTPSGGLGHDWYGPGQNVWGVETIGGSIAAGAEPHAIVTPADVIHVFYRTPTGGLGHDWQGPGQNVWGVETLGGSLVSEPHPVSTKKDVVHVFYRTPSGGLGHDWYGPGQNVWGVETIGGSIAAGAEPHAIVTPADVIHVFYRTPTGGLGHDWQGPGQNVWGVETLAGTLAGGAEPRALTMPSGAVQVFFRNPSGGLGTSGSSPGIRSGATRISRGASPQSRISLLVKKVE